MSADSPEILPTGSRLPPQERRTGRVDPTGRGKHLCLQIPALPALETGTQGPTGEYPERTGWPGGQRQ